MGSRLVDDKGDSCAWVDRLPATAWEIKISILEKHMLLYARSDCSHMKFCLPHLLRDIVTFFTPSRSSRSSQPSPPNPRSQEVPTAHYQAPCPAQDHTSLQLRSARNRRPNPTPITFLHHLSANLLSSPQVVFLTSSFWSVAFSRAARTSFCVACDELMNTYLSADSTGFMRIAVVALPTLESSVKFAGVLPESEMVAVLVLRLKPRKPSSRPLRDLPERLWLYTNGTEGANQSKKAPTTRPVHVRPCPSLVFIYSLMSILP